MLIHTFIGLLAVFLDVYNTLPVYGNGSSASRSSPRMPQTGSHSPSSRNQSSITSFKDVIPGTPNPTAPRRLLGSRSSPSSRSNGVSNATPPSQMSPRRSQQQSQRQERPSTPSMRTIDSKTVGIPQPPQHNVKNDDQFADFTNFDDVPRNPVTVQVKPLPKIRLDLCPVPREEDEEEESSVSVADAKQKRKSKSSKSKQKHRRSSRR